MNSMSNNRNKATPKKASAQKKVNRSSERPPSKKGEMRSAPLAQSRVSRTGIPSISGSPYSGDGKTVVRHREYVRDINGSVAFSTTSFSINPGLSSLFPWLQSVAANYESYRFLSLRFDYETQKSASTNGRVALAVDFDAADSAPVNKTEMLSFNNAASSAVWEECSFRCDKKDLDKFGIQRFIRLGALASNLDIKTYDIGNLIVATQGCADTTAIGELYVTYEIELHTPQTSLGAALAASSCKLVGSGSVSDTAYLGTAATVTGGLPVTGAGNTLTFGQVGQFIAIIDLVGTAFVSGAPSNTGTATATFLGTGTTVRDTGNTNMVGYIRVTVNNIGETVIYNWDAMATTLTGSTVRIAQYQYSLN